VSRSLWKTLAALVEVQRPLESSSHGPTQRSSSSSGSASNAPWIHFRALINRRTLSCWRGVAKWESRAVGQKRRNACSMVGCGFHPATAARMEWLKT